MLINIDNDNPKNKNIRHKINKEIAFFYMKKNYSKLI